METNPLVFPYIPQSAGLSGESLNTALREHGAKIAIASVNWPDRFPASPECTIYGAHCRTAIMLLFEVEGNYLRAEAASDGSAVHLDSCVEFFVEPTGTLPYYNFEFNCIGTLHAAYRCERHKSTPLSTEEMSKVKRWPSAGCQPFKQREGVHRWTLTVEIPLSAMGLKHEGKRIEMKGNFYKCGDATGEPHYLSWAPIATPAPDFHRPEFFQPIILE